MASTRTSAAENPIARHGQLTNTPAWATALRIVAAGLAVVLASAGLVATVAVWDLARTVPPGVALIGERNSPAPEIKASRGAINVLLAGSDSGGGDTATFGERGETLNDVTMLLHVSADHRKATVISLPRDLIVPIASCPDGKGGDYPAQTNKLNTANSVGGLACIVKTVENLTGLTIPYAGIIEFQGVIAMSNAVGGVEVCVATAIHDRKIHFDLEAGSQTLKGFAALQFLRSRYGVGDGSDLGRISNQQVFLSALVRKLKSADTLGNPLTLYALAQAAAHNISLTNSLKSANNIVSVALALKNIDLANVVFVQYPNASGTSNGHNGVLPITSAATTLITAVEDDRPLAITGSTGIGSQLDPAAPTATPGPSSSPGSGQGGSPPASQSPGGAVELPDSIHGQTAAQQTCTKGQRAG